jgi:hypothetical protein
LTLPNSVIVGTALSSANVWACSSVPSFSVTGVSVVWIEPAGSAIDHVVPSTIALPTFAPAMYASSDWPAVSSIVPCSVGASVDVHQRMPSS